MRNVFNDINIIAHMWANQVQESARNNGSFYFKDKTIFSYGTHFPIAIMHTHDDVLFTLKSSSSTTQKHIAAVLSSCSHKNRIYCLSVIEANYGKHKDNIEYWIQSIKNIAEKNLPTARKPEIYINKIQDLRDQLNRYLSYFNIKLSKAQSKLIIFKESSELIENAKRAREVRLKAEALLIKKGKKIYDLWVDFWKKGGNSTKEFLLNHNSKEAKSFRFYYDKGLDKNLCHIRVKGNTIETSKGIELSFLVGRKYYNFYKTSLELGKCTKADISEYKMLNFKVNEISSTRLIVGCHTIPREEIDYIARELNW